MIVLNTLLPLVGPPCPSRLLPKFSAQKEYELCFFQSIPLLINSINIKRDGVRICLGKDVERWSIEGFLTPPSFRYRVNYIGCLKLNIPRSSGVATDWCMLPGWCCIAIAALEPGNGDSWYHMCAFRFHFRGRKVNWNQASHVRASSVLRKKAQDAQDLFWDFWSFQFQSRWLGGFQIFSLYAIYKMNRGFEIF